MLSVLLAWTTFTAVFPTIVLYRAAVQPNYEWGFFGVTGVGLSPGYLVILVATAWAWGIVYLGRRGTRPLFTVLLVLWNAFLLASIIYGVLRFGSDVDLRGDTMGIRVNLAVIGPVLFGSFLLLSVLWWWRHRNHVGSSAGVPWSQTAKVLIGLALALVPAIAVLFVLGDGVDHTNNDRVAIALIVAQSILLAAALEVQTSMAAKA